MAADSKPKGTTSTSSTSSTKGTSSTSSTKGAGSARRVGRPSADDKLAAALAETYSAIGMVAGMVAPMAGVDPQRAQAIGQVIAANSETCADAWVTLAKTNPAVKRQLLKLTEAGGWGTVVFAHVGIGMAIAAVIRAETPEAAATIGQLAANPELVAAMMGAAGGAPPAADGA